MPPQQIHDQFHVVLVEPGDPLNVGSVARAMMNLGFGNLHLVAPPRYDLERALVTACWAEPVLRSAIHHETLEDALQGMEQVVGFTARHGRNRPRHALLPDWVSGMQGEFPPRTALLFGPEDGGLRNEHLSPCNWLLRIPSVSANPAFNLSQAVLLALAEVSRAGWGSTPQGKREFAPAQDLQQLDQMVAEVLTRVRFYKEGTPEPLPDVVSHLLRRMDPDHREMQILLGMFGKINRALQGIVPIVDPEQPLTAKAKTPSDEG